MTIEIDIEENLYDIMIEKRDEATRLAENAQSLRDELMLLESILDDALDDAMEAKSAYEESSVH